VTARVEIPVTWGDTDAGGLIYYPRFFHFFVVGLNAYFEPIAPHFMQWLRDRKYVLPSVEASASFEAPLRAGDTAAVETTVETVGTSSFTATFEIGRVGDDVQVARGRVAFVLVDETFDPASLPDEVHTLVRERAESR
jgi:acyl-CoA thioester hydrolase